MKSVGVLEARKGLVMQSKCLISKTSLSSWTASTVIFLVMGRSTGSGNAKGVARELPKHDVRVFYSPTEASREQAICDQ